MQDLYLWLRERMNERSDLRVAPKKACPDEDDGFLMVYSSMSAVLRPLGSLNSISPLGSSPAN